MRKYTPHAIVTIAILAGVGIASQALKPAQPVIDNVPTTQVDNSVDNQKQITVNRDGPPQIYEDVSGVTNPDISQANISQNICNKNWSTKSIRPSTSVTQPIKVKALARYNQEFGTSYQMKDGELDHLISLEIGGAPADPNNLWFEPYITQINNVQVGAHEKDKVENELHKEVCAGDITLEQAQAVIVNDWYGFYQAMNIK